MSDVRCTDGKRLVPCDLFFSSDDVVMSNDHRLLALLRNYNHRIPLPVNNSSNQIMRFFSHVALGLSVLVVVIQHNQSIGGGGGCSATTTSMDGNAFRPKPQVAGIVKIASPFNAAVLDIPKNDRMITQQPQRGGATTKPTTSVTTATNGLPKALAGAITFAMIEKIVKMSLKKLNIAYPAQLGACIVLFVVLCITDAMISPILASNIFAFLTPGAALLAKWFPIFFIPGLVLLPLSPPIGGTTDILKILATVIIGFVYSLSSTLLGVTTVRSLQSSTSPKAISNTVVRSKTVSNKKKTVTTKLVSNSGSPFSEAQWNFCWKFTIVSGILSIATTKAAADSFLESPLQMIFTLFFTVTSYIWGSRLPTAFVKLCHPLVTSSVLLLGLIRGLAYVTGRDYLKVLASYKTGTLSPLHAGAGDYLLYLLGPGVVAFAVSVYGKRSLLFSNLPMVLTAMIVSSVGGLFATGAFVRLIQLGGPNGSLVRLSVLARNVTMALAMALTDMIGGDVAIIALVVCLTGIIGASYGIPLLDAMGVTDPICRGLGIGSSAQGLGVASIAGEPDAFAFASVAMVLTAVAGTTIVSFPAVRNALIQVTTGQSP